MVKKIATSANVAEDQPQPSFYPRWNSRVRSHHDGSLSGHLGVKEPLEAEQQTQRRGNISS